MAIAQIAQAAQAVFPTTPVETSAGRLSLRTVMLAIAGAETGGSYNAGAAGDCGLPGPSCGPCDDGGEGATSWGAWQIHSVHSAYLERATGSSDPCAWRTFLSDPVNCARAALAVYDGQGLGAWTTYNTGAYRAHLAQAEAALASLSSGGGQLGRLGAPSPGPSGPPAWMLAVGAGGVVVGAGVVAIALRPDLGRRLRQYLLGTP